jgi:hypothetical protein
VGIVIAGVVSALGAAVAFSLVTAEQGPKASEAPIPSRPTETRPPVATIRSFRDFSILPGQPPEPIGASLQSRLWTVEGRWWGALVDPATRATRIFALSEDETTWRPTGVLIDERLGAVADALWTDDHLYVATTVPGRATASGVRVTRFSRSADGAYSPDPDFPVRVNAGGQTAVSIAKDGSGTLWVAFVRDGDLLVAHSLSHEAIWSAPVPFPAASRLEKDDLAALVALDDGRIAAVWSDASARTVWLATHTDGDPPDRWSDREIALDGMSLSDNALSAVALPDGGLAVAIETGTADEPNASLSAVQSVVTVRDPDGTWRRTLLSRVEDHLGAPVIVVDANKHQLHVFSTSPRRAGNVYMKSSTIDQLEFGTGRGDLVIGDPSNPDIAIPTSTKDPVDLDADFVVLGFDRKSGTYWHAALGPGVATASPSPGRSIGSPAPSQPRGSVGPSPSAPPKTVDRYIGDSFDPWPVGEPIGNGWILREEDPQGSLTAVADKSGSGRHARLTTSTLAGVRACKSFSPVSAGTVTVETRVRLEAIGPADSIITSVRDASGESASVRFGQGGTFAYFSGKTKVRSAVAYRTGVWYRSIVSESPATGTYSWTVEADDRKVLFQADGIRFRDPEATSASSVCLQTSEGKAGLGMLFDDVIVGR